MYTIVISILYVYYFLRLMFSILNYIRILIGSTRLIIFIGKMSNYFTNTFIKINIYYI